MCQDSFECGPKHLFSKSYCGVKRLYMPILKCSAYNNYMNYITWTMEEVQTAVWFGDILGKCFSG